MAGLKGRRQHAKTDRLDARHLRELLEARKLPECGIPPHHVLEIRAKVRLYKDLLDERSGWQQRVHATLFHLGARPHSPACSIRTPTGSHVWKRSAQRHGRRRRSRCG